ncbi:MAG: hypothetical protein MJD61_19935 [Proteobacteria bacterium]|nr:hypothetical protein [Pseudomonadota bacterium]
MRIRLSLLSVGLTLGLPVTSEADLDSELRQGDASWQKIPVHPPDYTQWYRAGLLLAFGTEASVAYGLSGGWWTTVQPGFGPGRLVAGAGGQVLYGSGSGAMRTPDPTGTTPADGVRIWILAATGHLRYVLDVEPQWRPWVGLGVGLYGVVVSSKDPAGAGGSASAPPTQARSGLRQGLSLSAAMDYDAGRAWFLTLAVSAHVLKGGYGALLLTAGRRL